MQLKRGHRLGTDWWSMKSTQSSGTRPVHQTVAPALEFKADGSAIAIEFTEQRLSAHAGTSTFWGWLRPLDWRGRLEEALPHAKPTSNKELQHGFALTTLCLESFWATKAALSLSVATYNLSVLFQRHLGWQKKVTIH